MDYPGSQTGVSRRPYPRSQDPSCHCHCQECLVSQATNKKAKQPAFQLTVSQDLHYTEQPRNDQDPVRQGIVPMETPFIMDNVMDDGMAACSLM